MIKVFEILPGVLEVTIVTAAYGETGRHWKSVLGKRNHGGFGRIYIDRFGTKLRRRENLWAYRDLYKGYPFINLDECPGAMFLHDGSKDEVSVEPVDAFSNQKLGRELGNALRKYPQNAPEELWEVKFRFV